MQQSTIKTLVDWSYRKLAAGPCSIDGRAAAPLDDEQCKTALVLWGVLLAETTETSLDQIKPYLGRAYAAARADFVSFVASLDSGRTALLRCDWHLLNEVLTRYIPNLQVWFNAAVSGDPDLYGRLNSVFSYLRKIQISRPDLVEEAYQQYLSLEEAAANAEYGPSIAWALDEMNFIIRQWFSDFHITDYRPHHGPGAVAEPGARTVYDKYQVFSNIPTVGRLLDKLGLDSLRSYVPPLFRWRVGQFHCDYTSKWICVPKSYKAVRSVKPEPVPLQWAQKGVQDELYKYIEHHPYLHRVLPLRNQGQNAELARQGSKTNWFATLDLSHASDSVTTALVARLFEGTELLEWQLATRSTHTRREAEKFPTSIFAGMGSSLCFPTESIIFAAACELTKRHGHAVSPLDSVYSVYGDDIIVPTAWGKPMIWLLTKLGFEVNQEKSFLNGPFRESCGMEAFLGYDVTPIRYSFSTPPKGASGEHRQDRRLNAIVAASGCQAANRAILEYGYVDLRCAIIEILRRSGYSDFVYTDTLLQDVRGSYNPQGCMTFYSNTATNAHLPSRWNESLQRREWKGFAIYTRYNHNFGVDCDELRLWEWLRNPPQGEVEMDPYALLRASRTHLSRRWVGW